MLLGTIVEGWPCAVIEGNSHGTKLVYPLSKRETGGVLDMAGEDEEFVHKTSQVTWLISSE
jgi:hypothetical protein